MTTTTGLDYSARMLKGVLSSIRLSTDCEDDLDLKTSNHLLGLGRVPARTARLPDLMPNVLLCGHPAKLHDRIINHVGW